MKIVEFDAEKAKAGHPVKTRGGSPVRIVCFDAIGPEPLVVLLKRNDPDISDYGTEEVWLYSANGRFNINRLRIGHSQLDLVMAE